MVAFPEQHQTLIDIVSADTRKLIQGFVHAKLGWTLENTVPEEEVNGVLNILRENNISFSFRSNKPLP